MDAPRHDAIVAPGPSPPSGPCAPGVTLDRRVIVSGQGATDPATGELVGTDVTTRTRHVFRTM
jgi:2-iminobutanoate/2-iminopropanoate deaminase